MCGGGGLGGGVGGFPPENFEIQECKEMPFLFVLQWKFYLNFTFNSSVCFG